MNLQTNQNQGRNRIILIGALLLAGVIAGYFMIRMSGSSTPVGEEMTGVAASGGLGEGGRQTQAAIDASGGKGNALSVVAHRDGGVEDSQVAEGVPSAGELGEDLSAGGLEHGQPVGGSAAAVQPAGQQVPQGNTLILGAEAIPMGGEQSGRVSSADHRTSMEVVGAGDKGGVQTGPVAGQLASDGGGAAGVVGGGVEGGVVQSGNLEQVSAAASRTYTIKEGDSFASIARSVYGKESRWVEIASANPKLDPKRLHVGQSIRLPDSAGVAGELPGKGAADRSVASGTGTNVGGKAYVVQAGDTFWSIAQAHYGDGERWRTIYQANRGVVGADPNNLRAGLKLVIPPTSRASRGQ